MVSDLTRPQGISNRPGKWPSLKHGSPKLLLTKPLKVPLERELQHQLLPWNQCHWYFLILQFPRSAKLWWAVVNSSIHSDTRPPISQQNGCQSNHLSTASPVPELSVGAGRQGEPLFPCGGLPGRVRLGGWHRAKRPISECLSSCRPPVSLLLNEPSIRGEGSSYR